MKSGAFLFVAACSAASAYAQQGNPADAISAVSDLQSAQIDADSVRELGGTTRFDVRITWKDASKRPPGEPAERRMRYQARCAQGTITVVAISMTDENGRFVKMVTVPPGTATFVAPPPGSSEAEWLKQVCRSG